jgi:tetratricopeptide (TPR) repeat protein
VDEIRLLGGTNISVQERGRWRDRVRGRGRRTLFLGMGTFDGFSPGAFRAVLAHEYGHFLHGDTAGGVLARRVNANLLSFGASIMLWRGDVWWNIGWQFFRLYHFLFRRITLGASRLQEIHADRVSVFLFGPRCATDGLAHVLWREAEYQVRVERVVRESLLGPGRRANADPFRSGRAGDNRRVAELVAMAWRIRPSEDETHPTPAQRLEWFQATRTLTQTADQSGAIEDAPAVLADAGPAQPGDLWALFADPDRARAEWNRRFDADVLARLDERAGYFDRLIAGCTAVIQDHPERVAVYLQRASAFFEVGNYRAAIGDCNAALGRGAPVAMCAFQRGVARSHLGDPAAVADFEEAIRRAPGEFERPARIELGDHHARAGDDASAQREYGRALELHADANVLLKRRHVRARMGVWGSAVVDFSRAIELEPESAEACVARAAAYLGQDQYEQALADAERAVVLDPRLSEARLLVTNIRSKQPEESHRGDCRAKPRPETIAAAETPV